MVPIQPTATPTRTTDLDEGLRGYRRILALGAHPDDIELGCGGTVAKATRTGIRVHSVVLSRCEDEAPSDRRGLRSDEFLQSAKLLGAHPEVFDIPNREFPEHRREVMKILEGLQERLKPDLVFIPFLEDPHQDHSTVAHAAVRTFRRRETVLQYEILRYGSHSFTPSLFIDIGDTLEDKVRSLVAYKTQLGTRAYFDEESFRSLARTRGAQSGYDYAEGFVLYKMFW